MERAVQEWRTTEAELKAKVSSSNFFDLIKFDNVPSFDTPRRFDQWHVKFFFFSLCRWKKMQIWMHNFQMQGECITQRYTPTLSITCTPSSWMDGALTRIWNHGYAFVWELALIWYPCLEALGIFLRLAILPICAYNFIERTKLRELCKNAATAEAQLKTQVSSSNYFW